MALKDSLKHFRDFDGYSGTLQKADIDNNFDLLADNIDNLDVKKLDKPEGFVEVVTTTDDTTTYFNNTLSFGCIDGNGFGSLVIDIEITALGSDDGGIYFYFALGKVSVDVYDDATVNLYLDEKRNDDSDGFKFEAEYSDSILKFKVTGAQDREVRWLLRATKDYEICF